MESQKHYLCHCLFLFFSLPLTFPRAKLRQRICMTPGRRIGRGIGRNFGQNYLGIFVLHILCRATHQNFSQNSSQFVTPCLVSTPVAEISKFHLRELLGFGAPDSLGASKSSRNLLEEGKRPHPQDFSLTKKTARFTKGRFRPY